MNDFSIEVHDEKQDPEWDDYIKTHPDGTLYQLSAWKKAIESTFSVTNSYFTARRDNKICGVIPLFILKTLFSGTKAFSLPYSVYGGILGDTPEIQQKLIEFAMAYTQENKAEVLELRYMRDFGYNYPKNTLYVTYRKRMPETPEDILQSIPRKSRSSIRNSIKRYPLCFQPETNPEILYKLYALNKRNLGSPAYPKAFFTNLLQYFGKEAGMHTTWWNDKPLVSVIYFYFKDAIQPYFSGADNRYYYTNASDFTYYELMKFAVAQGHPVFDFGRSRKGTGAGRFKENLGFEPIQLHYYYCQSIPKPIPNISPSNPKFNLATALWKRLPVSIASYLGSKITKYFP